MEARDINAAAKVLLENGWSLKEINNLFSGRGQDQSGDESPPSLHVPHHTYGYWLTDPDGNWYYDTGFVATVMNYSIN